MGIRRKGIKPETLVRITDDYCGWYDNCIPISIIKATKGSVAKVLPFYDKNTFLNKADQEYVEQMRAAKRLGTRYPIQLISVAPPPEVLEEGVVYSCRVGDVLVIETQYLEIVPERRCSLMRWLMGKR